MKKALFFLLTTICFSGNAQQLWRPLGADDYNQLAPELISMIDLEVGNNIVYAAYKDVVPYNDKISVRRFINNHWEYAGTRGFSASTVDYIAMAIVPDGLPFVAYKDIANGQKVTVQKFNGTDWQIIGTARFTLSISEYVDIAVDQNNVPYVAARESGSGGQKVHVRKFNGTTWELVGLPLSDISGNNSRITISNDGTLYVAYTDSQSQQKMCVKKFNGISWVSVGTLGFSTGVASRIGIDTDNNNLPYVIYSDISDSSKAKVQRFDGSDWVWVGVVSSTGFSYHNDIAIDNENKPLIVYYDSSLGDGYSHLKKFDGSIWQEISPELIGEHNSLTIDNQNHIYVTGSKDVPHAFKFNGTNWEHLGDRAENGDFMSINNNDEIYLTNATNNTVLIKKFVNGTWQTTTTGINHPDNLYATLLFDSNNTSYIVSEGISGSPIVYKLTDLGWNPIGSLGGRVYGKQGTAIDSQGKFYLATSSTTLGGKVRKFPAGEEVGWDEVLLGAKDGLALALNQQDLPYVAFEDYNNAHKIAVYKRSPMGTTWNVVGTTGFSAGAVYFVGLKIDPNNVPYVVYTDLSNGSKVTVQKFNGTTWETVGGTVSESAGVFPILKMDQNGVPTVAYQEELTDFRRITIVKKLNGTQWEMIGNPQIFAHTGGASPGLSLEFNSGNIPFVSSGAIEGQFIKYYGEELLDIPKNNSTEKIVTVYPNPVANFITIDTLNEINKIEIFNLSGQRIIEDLSGIKKVDLSALNTGVYLLKIWDIEKVTTLKIIKK